MHSSIYQLSDEPIAFEDYLDEDTMIEETNMLWGVADYFNDDTDREDDINWLVGALKEGHGMSDLKYDKETGKITFTHKDLERFLSEKIDKLENHLEELRGIDKTDKEKGRDISMAIYLMKDTIEDKFGFYVWYEGCWNLDAWLVDLMSGYRAKDTYEFYIGATIDYHS